MRKSWIAVAGLLAACAGGSVGAGPESPAPSAPAFIYTVPQPASLTYERVDTSLLSMEITGMGPMDIDVALRTVAQLNFQPDVGDALRVGITFTTLEANISNPMSGSQRMSQTPGPAVVRLEGDGDVEVLEKPALPAELAQVAGGESLVRNYFVQFPAQDAQRGVAWVDTLRITEDADGLSTTTESIVHSTWVRDTTLAGVTLRVVESVMDVTARVAGSSQGTRIEQSLAGNATATTLWDPRRHLIVERHETGEMSGTMGLPDMGMSGMPVSMTTRAVLRLQETG